MSHLLNSATTPKDTESKSKFNFLRNGATNVPTPNLAEQKKIMENQR
jgi:hypothetical protein